MSIALASAPVSFGVWGPHSGPPGVSGAEVVSAIAEAGYAGTELGPLGYLGDQAAAATTVARAGLQAAGTYVGLHPSAGGLSAGARAGLVAACQAVLGAERHSAPAPARASSTALPPGRIVLALEGGSALRDHPARATSTDPTAALLDLDDDGWRSAAVVLRQAQEVVRGHGLEASLHPHLATAVESRAHVERLLDVTDIGVTLDTGHLQLAGADPLACLRAWGERVDHVHLKDVDVSVLERARARGRPRIDDWWGEACVPLGHGDVDLHGVLAALVTSGYTGWVVVEQDHTPTAGDSLAVMTALQRANRERLKVALAAAPTP